MWAFEQRSSLAASSRVKMSNASSIGPPELTWACLVGQGERGCGLSDGEFGIVVRIVFISFPKLFDGANDGGFGIAAGKGAAGVGPVGFGLRFNSRVAFV